MTVSVYCRCFSVAVHARTSSDSDHVAESPAHAPFRAGQPRARTYSRVAAVQIEPLPISIIAGRLAGSHFPLNLPTRVLP